MPTLSMLPVLPLLALSPLTIFVIVVVIMFAALIAFGGLIIVVKCYQKVQQGTAFVRTGRGGTVISFDGMFVLPIIHRVEAMDISVKRVEIYRHGSEGLICKDNVRADIKVAFFVRVNNKPEDVKQVAQSIGCRRASDQQALIELFDAKFSEALKTVGKQFDFTDLYSDREGFKHEILKNIGTNLNGYILDDAAIDYLEQTPIGALDPNNILDSDGIKKITDRTAEQQILANHITREKEKTIKKQDVEAREAILELERQQAEAEQRQKREIQNITAREQAEIERVNEEERIKGDRARIQADEELGIQEENKQRQILVAERNKQRTDAIETERVHRDRELESTERERVVELARIEKEKAVEVERKNIQEVIRERVMVERAVVEEQEKIKDTEAFAGAERSKRVKVVAAEAEADESMVKEIKAAEAQKAAAKFKADEILIAAEADRASAEKRAQGMMKLAEAHAAEHAAEGLADAQVETARAASLQKYGTTEADIIEKKGSAEANAMRQKYEAEADGILRKADAMKQLDGVGKEHEEFKLQLDKEKAVELAEIHIRKDIAEQQAVVLGEALKSARIDIVGGDGVFFDRLVNSITNGKRVDRMLENSTALTDVKNTFFNGDPAYYKARIEKFIADFGINPEDLKNLSVAALLTRMIGLADDSSIRAELQGILGAARASGMDDQNLSQLGIRAGKGGGKAGNGAGSKG